MMPQLSDAGFADSWQQPVQHSTPYDISTKLESADKTMVPVGAVAANNSEPLTSLNRPSIDSDTYSDTESSTDESYIESACQQPLSVSVNQLPKHVMNTGITESKSVPLRNFMYFNAVLNANGKSEKTVNNGSSTKTPDLEHQRIHNPKKIKELKFATKFLPTRFDDQSFTCIVEKINELINKDTIGLIQYLNSADTVKEIKSLNSKEKSKLTRILFNDPDRPDLQLAIASQTGQYLVSRRTSDQFMVGFTGSLIEAGSLIEDSGLLKQARETAGSNFWLDVFRTHNASHLPESATRKLADSTADNMKYFGFKDGKATKNIARSCPICQIPQTNRGKHNKIFHPDSMVEIGPDHKLTTHIYSKDFLAFMNGNELTAREKKRLFPPALFSLFNEHGFTFSALSESALIFPEAFLSPALCRYIDDLRESAIRDFADVINGIVPPGKRKATLNCYRSMIRFSTQIPVLARVGAEIEAILKEQNIPIPSGSVAERYYIRKFSTPIAPESIGDNELDTPKRLLALNMSKRLEVYAFLAGNKGTNRKQRFFQREQMQGVVRKAMDKVCADSGSDLRPGSAPIFIGFIPPFIADCIARQHGFLDSNWSGGILHGKYSHSLALTCLANLANLDQAIMKTIVDNGLWGAILDQNPYNCINIKPARPNLPFLQINPETVTSTAVTSPVKHHQLLTTGQLSISLADIARVISRHPAQAELLQTLARRMGMDNPLTLEQLQQVTGHIRVLELVLSTKHLNSMEELYKARRGGGIFPHNLKLRKPEGAEIGDLPDPGDMAQKIKAKKYFRKGGYQIKGIVIDDMKNMCSNGLKLLNIEDEKTIKRCHAFIAFPPEGNTNTVDRIK